MALLTGNKVGTTVSSNTMQPANAALNSYLNPQPSSKLSIGGNQAAPTSTAIKPTAAINSSTISPVNSYTIKSGDTLSAIASKYGTTAAALASANGISNPDLIIAGKSLTIPSAVSMTTPKPVATTPVASNYTPSSSSSGSSGGVASSILGSNNASTISPINPAPQTPVPQTGATGNTYSGLVSQLLAASQMSPAEKAAREKEAALEGEYSQNIADIQGTPSLLTRQTGQEAIQNELFSGQKSALEDQIAAEVASRQANVSGLTAAVGAAGQTLSPGQTFADVVGGQNLAGGPTQVPYGTQFVNPANGQNVLPNSGQFGTGPAAAANVQSIQEQTGQVNQLSAARQSASNLAGQLSTFLATNNVNPSDFNAVNRFLQGVGAQTSSPQYQTYSNLVNDLASTYAQVLTPPGGSATDMTRTIAQSMLNASASGKSIIQVMQSLDSQAQAKIQGLQQNVQTLNSGGNVNSGGGNINGGANVFATSW